MSRSIRSFMKDKKGVSALEYAILAGLMALGVVATISTSGISDNIADVFTNVGTALTNASNGNSTPKTGG